MSYRIKLLKDGKVPLVFQRWINSYRNKKKMEGAAITISGGTGKVLETRPFDSSSGRLTEKFELSGRKGDVFDVTIRDTANGDWSLLPGEGFVHAAVTGKGSVKITRCGLVRFYFEVPAGKDVSISFYGAHAGGFGYWLFDGTGRLVKKATSWQPRHAISTKPDAVLELKVPGGEKKRLFSIVLWAENDALFKIDAPYVSADSAFFDAK